MHMLRFLGLWLGGLIVLTACAGTAVPPTPTATAPPTAVPDLTDKYAEYELVDILPRDAITAIDNPLFVTIEEADATYEDDELVIGVEFDGEVRAYSVPFLSDHEVVNDTINGRKIAITW